MKIMSVLHYLNVLRPRRGLTNPSLFMRVNKVIKSKRTYDGHQWKIYVCIPSALTFTQRGICTSAVRHYEVSGAEREGALAESDIKLHAVEIFKHAVTAVHPKQMIVNVLQFNPEKSTLSVDDKLYDVNRNIFLVGFGKAVLGMAKVVEEVLGCHLVKGIISIPKGLQEEMVMAHNSDMLLKPSTKVKIYEGADNNEVDEASYTAAKAIYSLVSKLTESDILIVLCSGGGSSLCPSPTPPITLQELHSITRLLNRNDASTQDLNTIRKNIEILKGGGLAFAAQPAQVITLILSSVLGDPVDVISSGPTYPSHPTPLHCLEILQRLNILNTVPKNIKMYLEKEANHQMNSQSQHVHNLIAAKAERDRVWLGIQNIVVGNNSIACEAAAKKATDLGYRPLILTTGINGEARDIGVLYAKLAMFVMICFDRKASLEPHQELTVLELDLVAGGIQKEWINEIVNQVDNAHNMNIDICIISGGRSVVHVDGSGVGGRNQEAALAASIQMKEQFREKELSVSETRMCFLSADSDGHDGVTKVAGAVVDQDFLDKVEASGLDMMDFLHKNDSFTFFDKVNNGRNHVCTNLTGTNIMDIVVLLVQKPKEKKYTWK